jgi:hypothetical protein
LRENNDIVRIATALWVATISVAAGQQLPTSPCDFNGFDTNSKLAEVAAPKSTIAYYACAAGKKCLSMTLRPADPIVVNKVEGDWTCGYLVARKGSAQGWVRSADIRLIALESNPPLNAWIGTWIQDENHIRIQSSKVPGRLALDGEAYWYGSNHNGHVGEISGEAVPEGNKLHFVDDSDICTVDLALIGKYMIANDNNMCGGVNVRFWGIWKRARLQDPLK